MAWRSAGGAVLLLAAAACAEKGAAPVERQAKRLESGTYGWVPAGLADRSGHAMAALGGKVYLFGGSHLSGWAARSDLWSWDGAKWAPVATPLRPGARRGHGMATLGARIVLFGGESSDGPGAWRAEADTWELDGARWQQRHPRTSPPARSSFAMAATGARVTLFGGVDGAATPLGDTWVWDGSDWSQATPAHSPPASGAPSMASDGARAVLVSRSSTVKDTWLWDGSDWSSVPVATPRGVAASLGGSVYVVGDRTWRWDGSAWQDLGASPEGFWDVAVASEGDQLVRYGGLDGGGGGTAAWKTGTWVFTGSTWLSAAGPSSPRSRYDHATATSTAGTALVFGGLADEGTYAGLDDTWSWDGSGWTQLSPATWPPPTRHPVLSRHGAGALLLSLTETWEWTGADWTQRAKAGAPPSAFGTMASALGRAVYLDVLGLVWEWDGAAWTKKTESGNAVTGPIAELDGKVVAYDHKDLLDWDGATWRRQATTGGPASVSQMVQLGDRLVALEATSADAGYKGPRTWELIGTTWLENTKAGFLGRGPRPMARYADTLVLFGAEGDTGPGSNTFVYRRLLAQGSACTSDEECEGRSCADGVCCDAPCRGRCESCAVPGALGRCQAVAGSPVGGREPCEGEGPCGAACDGADREACVHPGPERSCSGGHCAMRIAWLSAKCDGKGACVPAAPPSALCAPYDCAGDVCATSCAQGSDCVEGYRCQDARCVARLATGEACASTDQCASGHCVHGRCCESRCAGQCQACDVAGVEGRCVTVDGPPREDRAACEDDGVCRAGKCEGKATLGGGCNCGSTGGELPWFALPLGLSALSRGARSSRRSSRPPPTAG